MKKVLAFVLTIAMVVSILPASVLAVGSTEEDNTLVYVSIGDSMTNGYGLDGYDGESGVVNYSNNTYANQFAAWLAGYNGAIKDDQVILEGTNGTVDHRQLAMSGLRAEDLYWILTLDYKNDELMENLYNQWSTNREWPDVVKDKWYGEWGFKTGDFRTWTDFCDYAYRYADGAAKILNTYHNNTGNSSYFQSNYTDGIDLNAVYSGVEASRYFPTNENSEYAIMGPAYLQIATEFYQESVEDADIISLALGNTNFGTYMLTEIMEVSMSNNYTRFPSRYDIEDVFTLANLDFETEAVIRDMIDEYDVIIDQVFATLSEGNPEKAEALRNVIIYCITSYAVSYIGAVEKILEVNPDVDIIQVALMNAYADESSSIEGVTLGDIVDILYTPINAFIAAVPTIMQATGNYKDATFFYAEADTVECLVNVFGNDFYKEDGSYVEYPGLLEGSEDYTPNYVSTVRNRFVENIVKGQTFDMLTSFGVTEDITVAEIIAYDMMSPTEKAAYAATNAEKAKSIALYLAFENATIRAGKGTVTMDSLAALNGLSANTFAGPMAVFYANVGEAGKSYIDYAAAVVAAGSNGQLTADQVKALVLGGDEAIYAYIAGRSGGQLTAYQVKVLYEAENQDAAIFGFVASLSGGYLDAAAVQNLYNAVNAQTTDDAKNEIIYSTIANIANNSILTADTVKNLYLSDNVNAAIFKLIADNSNGLLNEDAVAQMYENGNDTYGVVTNVNKIKTAVAGVDKLWTAVNGVNSLKGVVTNVGNLKYAVEQTNNLCYLLALPQTLSDAMVADSTVSGILCMNARVLIGTGIGGHPSQAGHNAVYTAVQNAYSNEYTSQDKTLDNLTYIITEYYDEAYAYAYDYAEAEGYITMATDAIDGVIAAVESVTLDGTNATDEFASEFAESKAEIIETLEAAKALILEADELDQATLNAIIALLTEAGEDLTVLVDVLVQAGVDVNNLAIIPALKAAHKELTEVVIPEILEKLGEAVDEATQKLLEQLGDAYDAFVDAVVEAAKEYAPEIADWIYDYLYNNPAEVLAFINAHADEVDAFLAEYGDEALMVIGFLVMEYGDDVANYVMTNADEILATMVAWFDEHGENAWELIMVYVDELGLVELASGAIEDAAEELWNIIKEYGDDIYNEIMNDDTLKNAYDAIIGEIEDIKNQLATATGEAKAELLKKLADAKKELFALLMEAAAKVDAELPGMIEDALDAFVDAIVEVVKVYAPEAADAVYDFLYNNAADVIAFFREYGDDAVEFLKNYANETAAVLGFLSITFGEDVLNYVIDNAEEVFCQMVAWVEKHGENAWALIMVYLDELGIIDALAGLTDPENLEKVLEEVKNLIETYGPEVLDHLYDYVDDLGYIEALENIVKALEAEAERLANEVITEINSVIADLKSELAGLKAELDALYTELETLYAALENATGEARDAILTAIAEVENAIAIIEAAIAEIEATLADLEAAIAEIEAQIEAILAAAADLSAAIDNLIDVIANAAGDIGAAIDNVQAALDKIGDVIGLVAGVIDGVNDAVDYAQDLLANAVNGLLELRDEVKSAIENLKNAAEELTGEAKEVADQIIAELEEAAKLFDLAVTALAKKAEEVSSEVLAVLEEVTAAVEEAIAAFEAAYADATTGEYTVSEDSYYVSLGDGSVLSAESDFGYKLAEEIGLDVETQFAQLGINGLRAEDILALLDPSFVTDGYGAAITAGIDRDAYVAEIEKADLITVGLGQNNISEFVMSQVMSYAVYALGLDGVPGFEGVNAPFEMDWSRYVGAENVPYVEAELANVYVQLVANGVPEVMPYEYALTDSVSITVDVPVAAILTYMVECYAYGYTGYSVTYAEALNAIHEVNPDAEVIAVGMYNPIEGLVIDVMGTEVALGDYVDGLVEMSNVYGLVYAMVTPNTTFVEAPEVETYFDATGAVISIEAYLGNILEGGVAFDANDNGHEYIKDQILNALTITTVEETGLLGDVNKDGKVNNIDATLVLRYSVGGLTDEQLAQLDMTVGDVNLDGKVNNIDATIILRYSVGSVTELPYVA